MIDEVIMSFFCRDCVESKLFFPWYSSVVLAIDLNLSVA